MDAIEVQIIKVGPSLLERAERFVAKEHHKAVVNRLCEFRQKLEVGMSPEPWTVLETSAVELLADICDALHLTEIEKSEVLGSAGKAQLCDILDFRPMPTTQI